MNGNTSPNWNIFNQEDEDEDKSEKPIIKGNQDFFSKFLAERVVADEQKAQAEKEASAEDDEEDEIDPITGQKRKKKRFKAPLRSMLPTAAAPRAEQPVNEAAESTSQVEQVAEQSDTTDKVESANDTPIDMLSDQSEQVIELRNDAQAAQNEILQAQRETAATQEPEDAPIEAPSESNQETPDSTTTANEAAPIEPVNQVENATSQAPETEELTAQDTAEASDNETAPEPAVDQGRQYNFQPAPLVASAQETVQPAATQPTKEVIERRSSGGAIFAFLGANWLSKRRDKKLEKQIKDTKKEAEESIQEIKQSQLSSQQAQEVLNRHQQNELRRLDQQLAEQGNEPLASAVATEEKPTAHTQTIEHSVSSPHPQVEIPDLPAVEAPPRPEVFVPIPPESEAKPLMQEIKPEPIVSRPEHIADTLKNHEIARTNDRTANPEIQSEKPLEITAQDPIREKFLSSQEDKGNQPVAALGMAASPLGGQASQLSTAPTTAGPTQNPQVEANSPSANLPEPNVSPVNQNPVNSSYKQSVTYGAFIAVILLIAAFLVYILI